MPINFNGQESGSLESMPPDVRRSYQEALFGLVDATRTSVPNSALVRASMPRGHSEHFLRVHHRTKRTAAWMVPVLLALVMGGMLTAGAWLLQSVTSNHGRQGGNPSIGPGLMIAVAIMAAVGVAIVFLYRHLDAPRTHDTTISSADEREEPS
jgi:hypothetical protein